MLSAHMLGNGLGQIDRQHAARLPVQMALVFLQRDTSSAVHIQATQMRVAKACALVKLGGVGVGLPAGLGQLLLLPVGLSLRSGWR